jgi:hypothetical protein
MQDEKVILCARRDRIGMTLIVTELNGQRFVVKLLNDSANLPARELFARGASAMRPHRGLTVR